VSGTKKQIPKSAKWMTREGGSAGKSNVQPPEILRCLFNELTSNGLIMKSIEYKLATLQQQTNSNSHSTNNNDDSSMDVVTPSISAFDGSLYMEYAKALDEVAQKPIGRVASAVELTSLSSPFHMIPSPPILRSLRNVFLDGMTHSITSTTLGKKSMLRMWSDK
jgi:hypothetical protein